MALDAGTTEVIDTPTEQPTEIALEATPTIDTPADEPQADAPEVATDASEVTTEGTTEEAADAPTEEVPAEAVPEPVTFDAATELPELKTQITTVLDKYELPAEVQAAFDALLTKAETPATPDVAIAQELADYGEPAVIKIALERDAYLSTVTKTENGYRPNTDKFVENLVQTAAPEVVEHLYFDLANTASVKYPGILRFEEGIVDALAIPGDTVGSVLSRYQTMVTNAKSGTVSVADVPKYIADAGLQAAYNSLPKGSREELDAYDPSQDGEYDYSDIRSRKLLELSGIQKGLDADQREQTRLVQDQQQRIQTQQNQVYQTQTTFYDGVREELTKTLIAESVFPTTLAARQNVALLMSACEDSSAGEYARQALEADGIKFDFATVRQFAAEVDQVSLELTQAKNTVDASGRQLNEIAVRQATRKFADLTRKVLEFGNDIVRQEQKLTATGTAKAVAAEVEKIKIAPKARAVPKGVSTPAKKTEDHVPYKSQEWYSRIADRELEAERRRAQAYAQ